MTVSNYCSCDDIDEIHIRNQNKLILNINKKYENYFNNCFVNGAIYPSSNHHKLKYKRFKQMQMMYTMIIMEISKLAMLNQPVIITI